MPMFTTLASADLVAGAAAAAPDPTGPALGLAVSVSAFVALSTGVLARCGGAGLANAAIKGGAAFGGALALAVAILIPLGLL